MSRSLDGGVARAGAGVRVVLRGDRGMDRAGSTEETDSGSCGRCTQGCLHHCSWAVSAGSGLSHRDVTYSQDFSGL